MHSFVHLFKIQFASLLRIPDSTPHKLKIRRMLEIVDILELNSCLDTRENSTLIIFFHISAHICSDALFAQKVSKFGAIYKSFRDLLCSQFVNDAISFNNQKSFIIILLFN